MPRGCSAIVAVIATWFVGVVTASAAPCDKPVYLTFDTGHMGIAPLVVDVLKRHEVRVTFFLADERTQQGGGSLDARWSSWWKERATEGHAFGSHTYDHVYWLADLNGGFRVKPSAGPNAGRVLQWTPQQYCDELERSARRFRDMTTQPMPKLFRAPGGKISPALLAAAKACGWTHVPWSPAGFLGDELPSDKYPNKALLERSLAQIRAGDVLLAHLGIWSRMDPWAPANLEPLIIGLKSRGFCFATLRDHPQYRSAFRHP